MTTIHRQNRSIGSIACCLLIPLLLCFGTANLKAGDIEANALPEFDIWISLGDEARNRLPPLQPRAMRGDGVAELKKQFPAMGLVK